MMNTICKLWLVLLLLITASVYAADRIEVLPLHNRSAEEIIPLLRPLLNPGEGLNGTGFQLILRADPARQDELRAVIAQLDQAIQQLRISVRRASYADIEQERMQAQVRIDAGGGEIEARGRAIVRSTEDRGNERNVYSVRAQENTPAFIYTGEAFPTPTQSGQIINGQVVVTQGIEYQQLRSGFYALARTRGDEVSIDISPQREVLDPRRSGHIQTTSLVTTVRGKLGEWLELGGTSQQRNEQGGGLLRSTRSRADTHQTLWLKVETAD